LQRLFTVFFLCNGSAIKGRDVSSVGSNAYSLKAAVTTGSGLIKGGRRTLKRGEENRGFLDEKETKNPKRRNPENRRENTGNRERVEDRGRTKRENQRQSETEGRDGRTPS
jgi:hypothetical protein